jgi:hypothetical protein
MSFLVSWILLSASAPMGADAAAACRAAHAADPPVHIACLEQALRGQNAPTPASADAKPKSPTGLGSEQIERQAAERPAPVTVQITSVNYDAQGLGIFKMADGQVWRETEATPPSLRLRTGSSYEARIERGKVRGYRLYVEGNRRMIKVERLK